MANLRGVFSHNSDNWKTPSVLYNYFMEHDFIDPCPYCSTVDNLNKIYSCCKLFINPPFSQLDKWIDSAIRWSNCGCEVFLLMPSRTDTKYFNKLANYRCDVWFFIGRLHFNDSKAAAPFPTMLVRLTSETYQNNFAHGTIEDFIRCTPLL